MPFDFDVVAAVTAADPSARRNEDSYFCLPVACLVLDGATGLSGPVITGLSDGHWFVSRFQEHARALASPGRTLLQVVDGAIRLVGGELAALDLKPALPAYSMPSAGMVAVEQGLGGDVFYRLGDCQAYLKRGEAVSKVFGPSPLQALDRRSIEAIRQLLRQGLSKEDAREGIMPLLRAHRSMMNTDSGYGALSPQPACLEFVEIVSGSLGSQDEILLVTDGFAAGIEVYSDFTAEDAFHLLAQDRSSELIERVRAVETEDSKLTRYPRLKQYDDATAVLLRKK